MDELFRLAEKILKEQNDFLVTDLSYLESAMENAKQALENRVASIIDEAEKELLSAIRSVSDEPNNWHR